MQQHPICTGCHQPLNEVKLEGHYAQQVTADVCSNCHLVWFDNFESVRLSGLGWVGLLREMMAAPRATQNLPSRMSCVRCHGALKAVRNLTRFGRTSALECEHKHGHYQSFALLLAERGLVRSMNSRDLAALHEEKIQPACLNCGAPVEQILPETSGQTPECSHCDTPLMLFDLPRLTQALLMRYGEELILDESQQQMALACRGCGQPLDATKDTSCRTCDHVVALPELSRVEPLLRQIEPILKAAVPRQASPKGEKLQPMQEKVIAKQWQRYESHKRHAVSSGYGDYFGDRMRNTRVMLIMVACLLLLAFLSLL
jgi:hypothetical protein